MPPPQRPKSRADAPTPKAPAPRQIKVQAPGPLLEWLFGNVEGLSRTEAKSLLKHRSILVNGAVATRHDTALAPGDTVAIGRGRESPLPKALPFEILYEDEHLIAINKPSGLLTVGTDSEKQRTVHRILGERERAAGNKVGRVFVIHRLDRETSGVVLFARTEPVKRRVQEKWESAEKTYLAFVEGTPRPAEGTLVNWLREDSTGLRVHVLDDRQRDAVRATTHYRVLSTRGNRSLVELALETGRKHQIRVQLAHLGHPVCGDERYGRADSAPRLALHATRLKVVHPITGKPLIIECPLPDDLARLSGKA